MAEEIILSCDLNRNFVVRGAKNEKIVLRLRLYTHPDFVKAHPKTFCDVVLLVDTSQSMDEPFGDGAKLTKRQGVMRAIESMLPALQPEDTFSLICYDSSTYVEFVPVPGHRHLGSRKRSRQSRRWHPPAQARSLAAGR